MRRSISALSVLFLMFAVAITSALAEVAPHTIVLTPAVGKPGDMFSVDGSSFIGFEEGQTVPVTFNGVEKPAILDGTGAFQAPVTFTVPDIADGIYAVEADDVDGVPTSENFEVVVPFLTLDIDLGPPGTPVQIDGRLANSSTVTLTLGGTSLGGSVSSNADGNFSFVNVEILDRPGGLTSISAVDSSSATISVSADFTVTPVIAVSSEVVTAVEHGESVTFTVTGRGLTSGSHNIAIDGTDQELFLTVAADGTSSVGVTTVLTEGLHDVTANGVTTSLEVRIPDIYLNSVDGNAISSEGAGDTIEISGDDFPGTTAITMEITGTGTGNTDTTGVSTSISSDGDGSFTDQQFTLPWGLAEDVYIVTVTASGFTASAELYVLQPEMSLLTDSVVVGDTVVVDGFDVQSDATITVAIDALSLSTDGLSGQSGEFSTSLPIPIGTAAGVYTVSVSFGDWSTGALIHTVDADATLTVIAPALNLNVAGGSPVGPPETVVDVVGSVTPSATNVEILFDGASPISVGAASNLGVFSGQFTVPNVGPGSYVVTARDNTSFEVTAPFQVTLTDAHSPSFSLIQEVLTQPGGFVEIPVLMTTPYNGGMPVSTAEFSLDYNPTLLTPPDSGNVAFRGAAVAEVSEGAWTLAANAVGSSSVAIALAGPTSGSVAGSNLEIARVQFDVDAGVQYGSLYGAVNVSGGDANDFVAVSSASPGGHLQIIDIVPGDVTGNGDIGPTDASNVLDLVAWGDMFGTLWGEVTVPIMLTTPNWGQKVTYAPTFPVTAQVGFDVANVDGVDPITSYDAALILQFSVGLIADFTGGQGAPALIAADTSDLLRFSADNARPGQEVSVSLDLSDMRDLYAGELFLDFDPRLLRLVGVSMDVPGEMPLLAHNEDDGNLRVAFASAHPVEGLGSQLVVSFAARQLDRPTTSSIHAKHLRLNQTKVATDLAHAFLLEPYKFQLMANYPNPFNPETWIPFELAADSTVTIHIYDLAGRVVRTLDLGATPLGVYADKTTAAYWDGRNEYGEAVSSGTYIYEIRAGSERAVRRMVVLK